MKKIISTLTAIVLLCSIAFAQKLPGVQKVSVFAPENIKIDGKANEWRDQFQAYNNATDVYYTLANDNENLYLVLRAKYHDVAQKIIMGGITLTINHATGKKDPAAVSFTYPVLRDGDMSLISNLLAAKAFPAANGDTSKTVDVEDLNMLLSKKSKQINTTGIRSFEDNTISVYNNEGLKAAELFNTNLEYTCELAIPLKLLSLPANQPFSYQIKVNEPAPMKPPTATGGKFPPPVPVPMGGAIAATDFWGEYTLAKK